MPEKPIAEVTFRLEGGRQDGGLVRAHDFVDWLERVLLCMRRLERTRTGSAETVYRIAGLSSGSAVVTLEAASDSDHHATAHRVVDDFLAGAVALSENSVSKLPYDTETRVAFANLAVPLRRHLRAVTISYGPRRVKIKPEQVASVSTEAHVESISISSYSGFIDALNVHADPVFYLYPTTGPTRIPCGFDPQLLLDDLRKAIRRYTTVFGAFEYSANSAFPNRIVVERVEVNPPESDLPTLRSLYGAAPTLAGGRDSVSHIRQKRDARP